jgi:hypothetical protein
MERNEGRWKRPGEPKKEQGRGQGESKKRQPLPNVWDVLERVVRLDAPDVEDRPRWGSQEYKRELHEVNRFEKELTERGTPRDNLILDLHDTITTEPTGTLPVPLTFRELSLEEFRQFRSRVELLPDVEIREELRKAKEEFERKKKAKPAPPFPTNGVVIV